MKTRLKNLSKYFIIFLLISFFLLPNTLILRAEDNSLLEERKSEEMFQPEVETFSSTEDFTGNNTNMFFENKGPLEEMSTFDSSAFSGGKYANSSDFSGGFSAPVNNFVRAKVFSLDLNPLIIAEIKAVFLVYRPVGDNNWILFSTWEGKYPAFRPEAGKDYEIVINYLDMNNNFYKIKVDVKTDLNGKSTVVNSTDNVVTQESRFSGVYAVINSLPSTFYPTKKITVTADNLSALNNFYLKDTDNTFFGKIHNSNEVQVHLPITSSDDKYQYQLFSSNFLPTLGNISFDTDLILESLLGHEASLDSGGALKLTLKASSSVISLLGLPSDAEIKYSNSNTLTNLIEMESQGFSVDFLGEELTNVSVNISATGFLSIIVELSVDKDGNILILNNDVLAKNTNRYNLNTLNNQLSIVLIPIIKLVATSATTAKVQMDNIQQLIGGRSAFLPGDVVSGKVIIENTTKVGYTIDNISFTTNQNAISFIPRTLNTKVVGFYSASPTVPLSRAESLFDLEENLGESYFNFLNTAYSIDDINNLEVDKKIEILNGEYLFKSDDWETTNTAWGGDNTAPYAYYLGRGDNLVLETNKEVRDFATRFFFENSLFFTLDRTVTPLSPSKNNPNASMQAYIDGTEENKALYKDMLKGKVLEGGARLLLQNLAWALQGGSTTNAFQRNNFVFGMVLELSYSPDVPGEIPDPSSSNYYPYYPNSTSYSSYSSSSTVSTSQSLSKEEVTTSTTNIPSTGAGVPIILGVGSLSFSLALFLGKYGEFFIDKIALFLVRFIK